MTNTSKNKNWQDKIHQVIYEADTKPGKFFDIILLWAILASIALVMLESIAELDAKYHSFFNISEWVITVFFTIEYILRIISVRQPKKYIFSFYGVIDLLSTIPKYLSLVFGGAHALVALRALRLLRVFRILKLVRFVGATNNLRKALKESKYKISVFISAVLVICIIIGTVMYLIEGDKSGFTSIPKGIYWAIVTLTTVGYGDIAPQTGLGQFIASMVMILGYGVIAIPTGIITAEIVKQKVSTNTQACPNCSTERHNDDATFCYKCGEKI
ncbi:MAG: ion transporter [Flavobacteriaceae bacterium]|nr:ion transporter [Flavobacteriaceae bacterium]